MAKANITMPDGTKMQVEGSPDEISALVRRLQGAGAPRSKAPGKGQGKRQRLRLVDHIEELINKGFFKTPRGLGEIRDKLREMGHAYPLTTLSPAMLRKVRSRDLRRLRESKAGNKWKYTQ